jgi:short-subunit dehydrogenase
VVNRQTGHAPVTEYGAPAGAPDPRPAPDRSGTRVALVTGASSGIGSSVAAGLARRGGWRIVLGGRDEERLSRVAARVNGVPVAADLTAEDGCVRLVHEAERPTGAVDLLVVSAGVGWAGEFASMPLHKIDQVFETDLTAAVRMVRLVLPGMVDRGSGHIVLIGSIAGAVSVRGEAVYSAAKAGLAAFAESLSYELAGTGVEVSVVAPGAVDTPFFARRGSPYARSRPRLVSADRVARAVLATVARPRREVYVPAWLRVPSRLRGAAPGLFRRLATRFG